MQISSHTDAVLAVVATVFACPRAVLDCVLRGYVAAFSAEVPQRITLDLMGEVPQNFSTKVLNYRHEPCSAEEHHPAERGWAKYEQGSLVTAELIHPGDVVSVVWPVEGFESKQDSAKYIASFIALSSNNDALFLTGDFEQILQAAKREGLPIGSWLQKIPDLRVTFRISKSPSMKIGDDTIAICPHQYDSFVIVHTRDTSVTFCESSAMLFGPGEFYESDVLVKTRCGSIQKLPEHLDRRVKTVFEKDLLDYFVHECTNRYLTDVVFGTNGKAPTNVVPVIDICEIFVVRGLVKAKVDCNHLDCKSAPGKKDVYAVDVFRVDCETQTVVPEPDAKTIWAAVAAKHRPDTAKFPTECNIPFASNSTKLDAFVWKAVCRGWERVLFGNAFCSGHDLQ